MAIGTPDKKGFLSKAWKLHGMLAAGIGLFGIPLMLGFLPKAAVLAAAADPGAGLITSVGTLWGMMGDTIAENAVEGWSILGDQMADGVSAAFNAVANAATKVPVAALPTPSL